MKSLLSFEHLGALIVVTTACLAVPIVARRRPGPWVDMTAKALGLLLLLAELSWYLFYLPLRAGWAASFALPLDLCDVAGFLAPVALWWRPWPLVELTYFWGVGGSAQALITPDLTGHFPSYPYWQFYFTHGAVVLAGLLLVIGMRHAPRPGAVPRIFLITLGLAVIIGLADLVTGGNYMFLRQPPPGSLLDVIGRWPWYIGAGALVALVVLVALDAPFWPSRAETSARDRERGSGR